MMNLLLCTLGASWAVIPEALAFLAPEVVDLYRDHAWRPQLERTRAEFALRPPDELWILTTGGARTRESLSSLLEWTRLLPAVPAVRVWSAAGTEELSSDAECRRMRELTYRLCLRASERAAGGCVVVSLAGGRKTMSADLQRGAELFGCAALLHVVGTEPLPELLRRARPADFTAPLPPDIAAAAHPVVIGQASRAEILDARAERRAPVDGDHFPLPEAARFRALECAVAWAPGPHDALLVDEVEARQREAFQILGNYLEALARDERHENWRTLYRLPPAVIDRLRRTTADAGALALIEALPRAELHCHLGGTLSIAAQKRVGQAVWEALSRDQREAALEVARPLLGAAREGAAWPWDWPETLRRGSDGAQRSAAVAALLRELGSDELARRLRGVEPRLALTRTEHGFQAYERPGELSGSAILGHSAAIGPYARELVAEARAQGLRYLEVRCSPDKYLGGDARRFVAELQAAIRRELAGQAPTCDVRMIWTVDRRGGAARVQQAVQHAVACASSFGRGFVVGLDLAGDEGFGPPEELAPAFVPAFESCLPLTIHAGELMPAPAVWHAAYTLHADRLGHGLSLVDNEELAARVRSRRVCVEVCPTSNREVVGFWDPEVPASRDLDRHPLQRLLELGVPVAICTDNPAFSGTRSALEHLVASRMCGGLSLWDVLALTRQAFVHCFLPAAEREALVKETDAAVFRAVQQWAGLAREGEAPLAAGPSR